MGYFSSIFFNIFIVIFALLFILMCIGYILDKDKEDMGFYMILTISLAVLAFIITLPIAGIWGIIVYDLAYEEEVIIEDKIYIYSLERGSDIQSNFVLGIGSLTGRDKYTMYKLVDGGYTLYKIDADDVIIYEGYDKPYVSFKRVKLITIYEDEIIREKELFSKKSVGLYVPNGTIINKYNV